MIALKTAVAGVTGVAGVVAALMIQPIGAPAAMAQGCPNIEVVFARGTGEPGGIGRVGQAFVDSLRAKVGGQSVGVYGVNYPANRLFLGAGDGAIDVNNRVQYMSGACPTTKMVLGGYSQGAAVIDIVAGVPVIGINLGDPLPPHLVNNVAAVAVFGNPANRVSGPITAASPLLGYKSIDLCNGGDPICSDGDAIMGDHKNYEVTGLANQAASFVAARV